MIYTKFIENLSDYQKDILSRFLIFLPIFLIFVFPIIHANTYYGDDWYRALWISTSNAWLTDHRPLGYLTVFITSAFGMRDIAPLSQIIGAISVALSVSILSLQWNYKTFPAVICFSFIFCQPFFLQNLSYHFDSMFMCFALASSLIPFYSDPSKENKRKLFTYSTIIIFLVLNMYQPTISVYLSISLFESMRNLLKTKKVTTSSKNFIFRLSSLGFSLLLFQVESLLFVKKSAYVSQHSEIIHSIKNIENNFHSYLTIFHTYFLKDIFGYFMVFVILTSIILFVKLSLNSDVKNKFIFLFFGLLIFVLNIATIPSLQIILLHPVLNSRTFISFGAILSMCVSFFVNENLKKPVINASLSYFAAYILFSQIALSFINGNGLKAQNDYRIMIADQMNNDYSVLSNGRNDNTLFGTLGDEKISTVSEKIFRKYHILEDNIKLLSFFSYYTQSPFFLPCIMLIRGFPDSSLFLSDTLSSFKENYRDSPTWKMINEKVTSCHVERIIHHPLFNTYKIGNYIISDYAKKCS
ncbi:hypothetical protein GS501_08365 [Saccharibacter sp. 17.LH.SD]|uniref:glucosyltransferase domain-containing protein n=1 Tax=Saccharibacter sp. 17.LH.SD TaxID=2689393 RepID=UPI001371F49E|nr:glucosyltransferase domain-containing protein [Saccharibacter sp. 17.LH.SD]MXV45052.1 hypothetical protein [Saccharibacter sp. 17.LH.SD]